MNRPVILLGAGGHAKVLFDVLRLLRIEVLGCAAPQAPSDSDLAHLRWLGDDAAIAAYPPERVSLVNAVGSTGDTRARRQIFTRLRAAGYTFLSLRHPASVSSELHCRFGAGTQVLAGAIINPGVTLGDNVLVNTRAVVEHDCIIGAHSHVASGAVLCGAVQLGEGVHVGAGATVIQGITVGTGALIASGSAVTKNVAPYTLVAGVPARLKKQLPHD